MTFPLDAAGIARLRELMALHEGDYHYRSQLNTALRNAAPALLDAAERGMAGQEEPTPEMIRAGQYVVLVGRLLDETADQWIARFYRAMLNAAPKPPEGT